MADIEISRLERPLVVHIVTRFAMGGMENGLVNLVNRMKDYRHTIIALTEIDPKFSKRIKNSDVSLIECHKPPGQTFKIFPKLAKILKDLNPAIVHTRNVGTIETQWVAWYLGVPGRVHGEHGWDTNDPRGSNRIYQFIRRVCSHAIPHFIALSHEQELYLRTRVGLIHHDVRRICNGVDCDRFRPQKDRLAKLRKDYTPESYYIDADEEVKWIAWAGRFDPIKNPTIIIHAFADVNRVLPHTRLAMIGDGVLLETCRELVQQLGLTQSVWLPGVSNNMAELLPCFDVFCMPSFAEGISNGILEAMAAGLPVVATDVGGNPDLILDKINGFLIPVDDQEALAQSLLTILTTENLLERMSTAARTLTLELFSLEAMVDSYRGCYYDALMSAR